LVAGEHVPDRFGESAGEADLGDLGAALFADACLQSLVAPGTTSPTSFTLYSLLKTTEQMLGINTYLGHAADPTTASMVSDFALLP